MSMRRSRGRSKKADAKRRKTTLKDRLPELDRGSPELRSRKLKAANGSGVPVELVDVAGVLHANELIIDEELVLLRLRLLAGWLNQVRVGLGLRQGNPSGLWAAITSGTSLGLGVIVSCDALCAKAAMACTDVGATRTPPLRCGDLIDDTIAPFPVCRCCALEHHQ